MSRSENQALEQSKSPYDNPTPRVSNDQKTYLKLRSKMIKEREGLPLKLNMK